MTASESSDITLTDSSLTSGTMSMGLSGITSADLTVTAATGNPPLIVHASTFSGATNLTVAGTVDATLYGGTGAGGTLTATGSGNSILIGEAGDTTLTDTGTGRNILIGGGGGGDTLIGDGNDILVGGTTQYDSDTPANTTALDAILAVWSSSDSYTTRIDKIKEGVKFAIKPPKHRIDAFNSHTIHSDSNANTLSDRFVFGGSNANALADPDVKRPIRHGSIHPRPVLHKPTHPVSTPLEQSFNWFVASVHDSVTKRLNEIRTNI